MRRLPIWVGLLVAAACKPAAPSGALQVGQVSVSETGLAGKPEIGESAAQLRKELQIALGRTGRFTLRADGPVSIRMEIDRAQRACAPVPPAEGGKSPPERQMADAAINLEMTSSRPHTDADH